MQTTNVIYRQLLTRRHSIEYKVEIAGETYNHTDIIGTPEIASAVFDKFSVGNAPSATLKISLIPKGTIPPMSLVEVYYRLYTPTIQSVWMPKGKFYIDTRKKDNNGILTLNCFDAMLKGEYTFMESGSWTSTTALATVQMIASDMGINIESNTTTVLTNTPKSVPYVPAIGEDGTTGRDMLCYIASMYGGNFIIDELGNLKLIQLISPTATLDIGVLASAHDTAPAFDAIDRVILKLDEKTGYRSPESTFDTLTGRILEAYCPWTSQTLADGLLSIVNGFVYQPYEAIGANIDPACQLGDGVTVKSITSQIYSQVIHLDARCADDISAPYEEEVNHEYPYRSAAQRKLDDSVTQEQLATAGQTTINGSNIHSGIITLGGDGNGDGELVILNENDNEFGRWNNERLLVYDDSTAMNRENARLAIIREGSSPDSPYGAFIGATETGSGDVVPFAYFHGTSNSGSIDQWVEIRTNQIQLHQTNPNANPDLTTIGVKNRSIGATVSPLGTHPLTVNTVTAYEWGRVIQLTIKFDCTSFNAGTVFNGSVNTIPQSDVMGCSFIGTVPIFGWLKAGTGVIEIRACGGISYSGEITMSWTFLLRNNE